MKKIFISYSRADYVDENSQVLADSYVAMIVEALKATNNIDVWIDINSIYSGKYFTNVLAKRILWADKVLFLSSKNSNSSEWVSKEILFAFDNKKEILPVRLDESNFNLDYALILTGIEYIDFYKNPKLKISDILENVLEEQELTENMTSVENTVDTFTHDSAATNNSERKGSLSLNVKYKGCVMSMTILMGVLFLVGVFTLFNKNNKGLENKDVLANNDEITLADYTEDTTTMFPSTSSQKQPSEESSSPLKEEKGRPQSSPDRMDNSNVSRSSGVNGKTYIAKRTNEKEDAQDGLGEGNGIALNIGTEDLNKPATSPRYSGKLGGPTRIINKIEANATDTYIRTFREGELAWVEVIGDGDTDLDVYVYDSNGQLVDSDTDYTDECGISWTPSRTEEFRIVIKNNGKVYNSYEIITNQ